MAITVEYLKGLGLEKDIVDEIFKERGKEIEAEKEKTNKIHAELKEAKETITTMTMELDSLKESNASAEEWRQKYETLQRDVSEKERIAKEEAAAAEKQANLQARYESAAVSKDGKPLEWAHEAIKNDYFTKFAAAVEDKANIGKSDADIFNSLVKDDATAFKGVQVVTLAGGKPINTHGVSKEDFMKMGYAERLHLKTEQPELYKAITENKE